MNQIPCARSVSGRELESIRKEARVHAPARHRIARDECFAQQESLLVTLTVHSTISPAFLIARKIRLFFTPVGWCWITRQSIAVCYLWDRRVWGRLIWQFQ